MKRLHNLACFAQNHERVVCKILTFSGGFVEHTALNFTFPLVICSPVLCIRHLRLYTVVPVALSQFHIAQRGRRRFRLLLAFHGATASIAQRLTLKALAVWRSRRGKSLHAQPRQRLPLLGP